MSKRTFQPNNRRRAKTHGFRARMATKNGRLCQGTQAPDTGALLKAEHSLVKRNHLRSSGEFRRVYEQGVRYDSRLLTAFVQPNGLAHHRFGITASRKATGNAVKRNRSKRLLRETFRASHEALDNLQVKYDWVFNAKRSLLSVKVSASIEDFQKVLARVAINERERISNLKR